MQRDVRVAAVQAGEQRRHQAGKGDQRIAAESAEDQIEPDDVGADLIHRANETQNSRGLIERRAAPAGKSVELRVAGRKFVTQDGEFKRGIPLQLLRDVKSIFAQSSGAWRKCRNQTDLHSCSASYPAQC